MGDIHHDAGVCLHLIDCDVLGFFVFEDLGHKVFSVCYGVHTPIGSRLTGWSFPEKAIIFIDYHSFLRGWGC